MSKTKTEPVDFRLNEKVWVITMPNVKCLGCEGTGRLTGPGFSDASDNRCPACYGNGTRGGSRSIAREGRISGISLSAECGRKYDVTWLKPRPVVKAGIGNGDTWGESSCRAGSNVFATRAEAMAEIRRRPA